MIYQRLDRRLSKRKLSGLVSFPSGGKMIKDDVLTISIILHFD
jgi:hypothetical protein